MKRQGKKKIVVALRCLGIIALAQFPKDCTKELHPDVLIAQPPSRDHSRRPSRSKKTRGVESVVLGWDDSAARPSRKGKEREFKSQDADDRLPFIISIRKHMYPGIDKNDLV